MPGSADRVSTEPRRWRRRAGHYATPLPRRRMSIVCAAGQWSCADAAHAPHLTPPPTWPLPCSTSFPTRWTAISPVPARTAARASFAPTVPTRPLRQLEGGELAMKIRLDRTVCDGFGVCAKHAPGYFSLDDWGYASLIGDGVVPEHDRDAVMRALLDCPVHAITEFGERNPEVVHPPPASDEDPVEHLKTESNEAQWGFTR